MSLSRFIFLVPKLHYTNNFCAPFTCGTKVKPVLSSFSPPRMDIIFGKKTLAEELGIPAPPKRPPSPFFMYFKEERENFSHITNNAEKMRKAGQNWHSLDESLKSKYFETYKLEIENYKKNVKKYKSTLSQEQIRDIKKLKEKKKMESAAGLAKQQLRKECEELGKPKHPGNAISLFMREVENQSLGGKGNQWRNLPESSKKSYLMKARKLMEQYQLDLYSWEMKMLASDRKDLVRISTLSNIKKDKKS
ncbi:Transcription factor A, mitochondrial [Armadillidium vulgare]|nr:Transcription factor A, mitochondrial [Armadillidium vulgare]